MRLLLVSLLVLGQFEALAQQLQPDVERQQSLQHLRTPKQFRLFLMQQEESPEARALAVKANNWRIASNTTYLVAGATAITSLIMVNNASNDADLGQAVAVGLSSIVLVGLGYGLSYLYTFYLFEATETYLYPVVSYNLQAEIGVGIRIGF